MNLPNSTKPAACSPARKTSRARILLARALVFFMVLTQSFFSGVRHVSRFLSRLRFSPLIWPFRQADQEIERRDSYIFSGLAFSLAHVRAFEGQHFFNQLAAEFNIFCFHLLAAFKKTEISFEKFLIVAGDATGMLLHSGDANIAFVSRFNSINQRAVAVISAFKFQFVEVHYHIFKFFSTGLIALRWFKYIPTAWVCKDISLFIFWFKNYNKIKAFAALLAVLPFLISNVHAANVHFRYINPIGGLGDTNSFRIWACSSNMLADGTPAQYIGLPVRIYPDTNGDVIATNLQINWYADLDHHIVFQVYDSSSALYDVTNLWQSGFNLFVVRNYGSNAPPNFTSVTNALGYTPVSPTQLNGTNQNTLATATNSFDPINAASNALVTAKLYAQTNPVPYSVITNPPALYLGSTASNSFDPIGSASNALVSAKTFSGTNALNYSNVTNPPVIYSGNTATNSFDPTNSAATVKLYTQTNPIAYARITNPPVLYSGTTATNSFDPTNSAANAFTAAKTFAQTNPIVFLQVTNALGFTPASNNAPQIVLALTNATAFDVAGSAQNATNNSSFVRTNNPKFILVLTNAAAFDVAGSAQNATNPIGAQIAAATNSNFIRATDPKYILAITNPASFDQAGTAQNSTNSNFIRSTDPKYILSLTNAASFDAAGAAHDATNPIAANVTAQIAATNAATVSAIISTNNALTNDIFAVKTALNLTNGNTLNLIGAQGLSLSNWLAYVQSLKGADMGVLIVSGAGVGNVNGTNVSNGLNAWTNLNGISFVTNDVNGTRWYASGIAVYGAAYPTTPTANINGFNPQPVTAFFQATNIAGANITITKTIGGTIFSSTGGGSGTTNFNLTGVIGGFTTNNIFTAAGTNAILSIVPAGGGATNASLQAYTTNTVVAVNAYVTNNVADQLGQAAALSQASTNPFSIGSGLAARAPTNQFLASGPLGVNDGSLLSKVPGTTLGVGAGLAAANTLNANGTTNYALTLTSNFSLTIGAQIFSTNTSADFTNRVISIAGSGGGGGGGTNQVVYTFYQTNLSAGVFVTNVVGSTNVLVGIGTNLTAYIGTTNGFGTNTTLISGVSLTTTNLAVIGNTFLNNSNLQVYVLPGGTTGLIPAMTGYTTPSGTASASQDMSGEEAWRAFDGTGFSSWSVSNTFANPFLGKTSYVQYSFPSAVNVSSFSGYFGVANNYYTGSCSVSNFTISASSDGTVWYVIYSQSNVAACSPVLFFVSFPTNITATYFRWTIANTTSNIIANASNLQLYNNTSPFNLVNSTSKTLEILATNGVSINTNSTGGNALEVFGNVDSTVGFTINGGPLGQIAGVTNTPVQPTNGAPTFDPSTVSYFGACDSSLPTNYSAYARSFIYSTLPNYFAYNLLPPGAYFAVSQNIKNYATLSGVNVIVGTVTNYVYTVYTPSTSSTTAAPATPLQNLSAVNNLVLNLKAAGLWFTNYAVYPFGSPSATCTLNNLMGGSPLTLVGSITNSTAGLTNTAGYATTGFTANPTNLTLVVFESQAGAGTNWLLSAYDSTNYTSLAVVGGTNLLSGISVSNLNSTPFTSSTNGNFFAISTTNGLLETVLANGVFSSRLTNGLIQGSNLVLAAQAIGLNVASNAVINFAAILPGLTTNQMLTLQGIVYQYESDQGLLTGQFNTNTLAATIGLPANVVTNGQLNFHNLYVSPNGNDATAVRGDISHPWLTIYDYTNSGRIGVMSVAANGDTVYVSGTNYAAVIPFFQPNISLVGQSNAVIIRSTNLANIAWTTNGLWTANSGIIPSLRNIPFLFVNDNIKVDGITFISDQASNHFSASFVGCFTPPPDNSSAAAPAWIGTNVNQILADFADNHAIPQFFGRWPEYGITNRTGTNIVIRNCTINFLQSLDVCYNLALPLDCFDTNDTGLVTELFRPAWGDSGYTFENDTFDSAWDMHLWGGSGVVKYLNCVHNQRMNYTSSGTASIYGIYPGTQLQDIGGTVNSTNISSTLIPLVARTLGFPGTLNGGAYTTNSPTALNLVGTKVLAFPTNVLTSVSPFVTGQYINPNYGLILLGFSQSATNLTDTLPDARLSANVALLNATTNKFTGNIIVTNLVVSYPGSFSLEGGIFSAVSAGWIIYSGRIDISQGGDFAGSGGIQGDFYLANGNATAGKLTVIGTSPLAGYNGPDVGFSRIAPSTYGLGNGVLSNLDGTLIASNFTAKAMVSASISTTATGSTNGSIAGLTTNSLPSLAQTTAMISTASQLRYATTNLTAATSATFILSPGYADTSFAVWQDLSSGLPTTFLVTGKTTNTVTTTMAAFTGTAGIVTGHQ